MEDHFVALVFITLPMLCYAMLAVDAGDSQRSQFWRKHSPRWKHSEMTDSWPMTWWLCPPAFLIVQFMFQRTSCRLKTKWRVRLILATQVTHAKGQRLNLFQLYKQVALSHRVPRLTVDRFYLEKDGHENLLKTQFFFFLSFQMNIFWVVSFQKTL